MSPAAGLGARNEECHGVLDRAWVRETSKRSWHISQATGVGAGNSRFRGQSIMLPHAPTWGPQPGPPLAPPRLRAARGAAELWGTGRERRGGESRVESVGIVRPCLEGPTIEEWIIRHPD